MPAIAGRGQSLQPPRAPVLVAWRAALAERPDSSWCAIGALFGGLRTALWLALGACAIDVPDAFAAGQSVLLACIAMAMLAVAWQRRERAALRDAIVVAAITGAKVFASDLVALQGVPRVLSVFSFGVLALVGSVVLSRWQSAADSRN
ncbi:MAG TPA: hypothetical protein VFD82_10570 [Planctomycetota bacterium]|nr:hypothetical protein [Planctomycetota bacterium]